MVENKKILIVGRSSFISQALNEHLNKTNDVTATMHRLRPAMQSYDIVINVACPASPGDMGIEILMANSHLVKDLLEYCLGMEAMFIQLSSGEANTLRPINHPHRCYSTGKQFAETLCYEYYKRCGVDTRIVRLYNTYGKGMRLDYPRCQSAFINDAINNSHISVKGSAQNVRTFTHVDDTVSGIETVIEKGKAGETYELANPTPITIADFAKTIAKIVNKPIRFSGQDLEVDSIVPDVSKLSSLWWTSTVELEEGLRKVLNETC